MSFCDYATENVCRVVMVPTLFLVAGGAASVVPLSLGKLSGTWAITIFSTSCVAAVLWLCRARADYRWGNGSGPVSHAQELAQQPTADSQGMVIVEPPTLEPADITNTGTQVPSPRSRS